MSRPAQAPDASMEDILASIRKIITEDAGEARAQAAAKPQPAKPIQLKPAVSPAPASSFAADFERELSLAATQVVASPEDDIFELADAEPAEARAAVAKPLLAALKPPLFPKPAAPVAQSSAVKLVAPVAQPKAESAEVLQLNGANGNHAVAVLGEADDILDGAEDAPIELAEPNPPLAGAPVAVGAASDDVAAALDMIDGGPVLDLGAPAAIEVAAVPLAAAGAAVAAAASPVVEFAAEMAPELAVTEFAVPELAVPEFSVPELAVNVAAAAVEAMPAAAAPMALPVIVAEEVAPVEAAAADVVAAAAEAAVQPEAETDAAAALPMAVEAVPQAAADDAATMPANGAGEALHTIDDQIAAMMKPMIKDWLDANMPRIMAKALAKELGGG